MNRRLAGLIVAGAQVGLLCLVGAGYLLDRSRMPHIWLATQPIDPESPIRGRYLRMSVVVAVDEADGAISTTPNWRGRLLVRDGALVATMDPSGAHWVRAARCGADKCWLLAEPVAFYLPERAGDPTRLGPGEKLWVEATIPPKGAPRPLRLGKSKDGHFEVIDVD